MENLKAKYDQIHAVEFLSKLLTLFLEKEKVQDFRLEGGEKDNVGLSIDLAGRVYIDITYDPPSHLEIVIDKIEEEIELRTAFMKGAEEAIYHSICSFLQKEVSK